MKYVSGFSACVLVGFLLPFTMVQSVATAETPCACPELACDACSAEHGTTFYSDKCGPDNSRMRSCKRPTCVPLTEVSAACPVLPAADSGPREPIVVAPKNSLAVTAEEEAAAQAPAVGKVKVIRGSVVIHHADGKKTVVAQDADVRETDTIASGADGAATVAFVGGNKLQVHPDTEVEIKEHRDQQAEASRKTLLNLIKGRIRNQVEQKYNGKTSYYRVTTKAAVAGVRGTDFVISYDEPSRPGEVGATKLETLRGRVVVSDADGKQSQEVARGEGVIWQLHKPGSVYKLSDDQMRELDRDSRVDVVARAKPVPESPICRAPKGLFNQCVWRCLHNPAGESKCRVDLPKVQCLRQRCNANGAWADDATLSGGEASAQCTSAEHVGTCNY